MKSNKAGKKGAVRRICKNCKFTIREFEKKSLCARHKTIGGQLVIVKNTRKACAWYKEGYYDAEY